METRLLASAAARAFTIALPTKVVSGSSGSARPSVAAAMTSKRSSSSAASSLALPGIVGGGDQARSRIETERHAANLGRFPPRANLLHCEMVILINDV